MRYLILLAELAVTVDALVLAAVVLIRRFARVRPREFAEVRDFALWQTELNTWMAAAR